MKRLFVFLLVGLLVLGLFPTAAFAEVTGRFKYELRDEQVWITGATSPITGKLEIPAEVDGVPVVGVAKDAFSGMDGITFITLPESLRWIEQNAFSECTGVVSPVQIPDGMEWIGNGAFYQVPITGKEYSAAHRYALTYPLADFAPVGSLHDWQTVTENGLICWIHEGEAELVKVSKTASASLILPRSVQGCPLTSVGPFAGAHLGLEGAAAFNHVAIPGTVRRIGAHAFEYQSLDSVFVEEGVEELNAYAFSLIQNADHRITLPQSLTRIGAYALAGWSSPYTAPSVFAYADTPAAAAAEAQGCKVIPRINAEGAICGCFCGFFYQATEGGVKIYDCMRANDGVLPDEIEGVPVTTVYAQVLFPHYAPKPLGGVYVPPSVTEITGTFQNPGHHPVVGVPGSYVEAWCKANGVEFRSVYTVSGVPFLDTPEQKWYYEAVCFCYHRGLMSGISDTEFDPTGTVTRAMLVSVLWRLSGAPAAETAPVFKDVAQTDWFYGAVGWAAEQGVVYGTAPDTFSPEAPATREQIATILYRYAGLTGMDTSFSKPVSGFPDAAEISPWALEAMSWARGAGIISGQLIGNDAWLMPGASSTRSELASILMRLVQK